MAKKQETKKVEVPTVETPIVKTTKPKWEIKDRTYFLKDMKPLGYHLRTQSVYYFDEEKGYERELCYSRNQRTCFVDEMKGDIALEHVWFRDGYLFVPRNNQTLQKLLSIYHPQKNKIYFEWDRVGEAADDIDWIELELNAMNTATAMDIDTAEAIMRAELGSKVSSMSSKELKRDLLVFARRKPQLFLELANDDSVQLRNIGIKAVESMIINLSEDRRTFSWASTGRKLMTVPFDEHPYSALAAWFKTDEGLEVLKNVEKQLNS